MPLTVTAKHLESETAKMRTQQAVSFLEPWYTAHVGSDTNVRDVAASVEKACTTA